MLETMRSLESFSEFDIRPCKRHLCGTLDSNTSITLDLHYKLILSTIS